MKFNARTFIFIRRNARMPQQEIAEKLGVSERTIQHWEAGRSTPNPRNRAALSELFQIEPHIFSYSDAEFYNYIMQHVHPAGFPLIVRSLFSSFWQLQQLPAKDAVLKQLAIFDRLMPLMHQGHQANLHEATAAQIADEELIRDASPYD